MEEQIDVKSLEKCFPEVAAELRGVRVVITTLEQENRHLRQVIEMLITSKSPTL